MTRNLTILNEKYNIVKETSFEWPFNEKDTQALTRLFLQGLFSLASTIGKTSNEFQTLDSLLDTTARIARNRLRDHGLDHGINFTDIRDYVKNNFNNAYLSFLYEHVKNYVDKNNIYYTYDYSIFNALSLIISDIYNFKPLEAAFKEWQNINREIQKGTEEAGANLDF